MREHSPDTTSTSVDEALQQLFAPVVRPRARDGFQQRLDRALVEDAARSRGRRRLTAVMWAYWSAAAVLSGAILWGLRDLLAGPGLWLGVGGGALLAGTALVYCLVVPLPLWRRRPVP